MNVTTVNENLDPTLGTPTAVSAQGAYIVISYGLKDVYFNDQGKTVFTVTRDPQPEPHYNAFQRMILWLKIQLLLQP